MNYRFSEDEFKKYLQLEIHRGEKCMILVESHIIKNIRFKLFPYTANGKTPIVTDMKEVIGDFIKNGDWC